MRTLVSSVTHAGDAGLSKCGLLEGSSLTFDLQLFLSSLSDHPILAFYCLQNTCRYLKLLMPPFTFYYY